MGGERFDTPQPEAYLFGENADLNFLGSKPTPVSIFHCFCMSCSYFETFVICSFHIHLLKQMNPQKPSRV